MPNVLLNEALSLTTFSYNAEKPGAGATIGLQSVEDGMLAIFKKQLPIYPAPKSQDLESAFNKADKDKDGRLTLPEFRSFLSIFLKSYRNGILNNKLASIIFNDSIFQDLWQDEQRLTYIESLKASFFKFLNIALHDNVRNQVGSELFGTFDEDKSGSISYKEFRNLMKDIENSEIAIATVFALVDTDHNRVINLSEFLKALEYYAILSVADSGYQISKETGVASNYKNVWDFLQSGANPEDAALLTPAIVQSAFAKADCPWWRNGVLNQIEWKVFATELIRAWKEKIDDAETVPPVTETETEETETETEEPETETEEPETETEEPETETEEPETETEEPETETETEEDEEEEAVEEEEEEEVVEEEEEEEVVEEEEEEVVEEEEEEEVVEEEEEEEAVEEEEEEVVEEEEEEEAVEEEPYSEVPPPLSEPPTREIGQLETVDFNGDGKSDFIRRPLTSDDAANAYIFLSNGDGTFGKVLFSDTYYIPEDNTDIFIGDFNADGKTDIFRRKTNDWADGTATAQIFFSKGDATFVIINLPESYDLVGTNSALSFGDFNGDGKTDFIRQQKNDETVQTATVYLSTGDGTFTSVSVGNAASPLPADYTNIIVGDFTGDGNFDFIRQEKGTWATSEDVNTATLFVSAGDGTFTTIDLPSTLSIKGSDVQLFVGDFNGDGIDDFLSQHLLTASTVVPTLFISDGAGNFDTQSLKGKMLAAEAANVFIGNFDGDLRYDFLVQQLSGTANPQAYLYQSSSATKPYYYYAYQLKTFNIPGNGTNLYVADFNGDGKSDLLRQEKGTLDDDDSTTASILTSNAVEKNLKYDTQVSGATVFTVINLDESYDLKGDECTLVVTN